MEIRRVRVWSPVLRAAHWIMALSVLVLLFTGWLQAADPVLAILARDYHYIFGAILLLGLIPRLYLLFFGRGTDQIGDCEPDVTRLRAALGVLRFYFSLGRAPLPRWYAHNPLWGPLYLLLFFFLVLQIASGFLVESQPFIAGISLADLHRIGAFFIGGFSLLHLVAVFVHDLGGSGSDVSAMINGYRIFVIEPADASAGEGVQFVSIDDLIKSHKPRSD